MIEREGRVTSSSSVFLPISRGGGELPNIDTAPAGSFFLGGALTGSFAGGLPVNKSPSSSTSPSSSPNRSTVFADGFLVLVVSV